VTGAGRGRLFVALDLPRDVRDAVAGWARRARRGSAQMRLVDGGMLHVTLCFLGSRPLAEVPALAGALGEAVRGLHGEVFVGTSGGEAGTPVDGLTLGAPLWLPPRRPRLLAVEIHDPLEGLNELHGEIVRAARAAIDWEPERRRFRPHVTVARMREGAAPRGRELEPTPALAFAGEAVTLYRSWLAPEGASYEALERVELAGA
jgi:2'-5' RNA ligase